VLAAQGFLDVALPEVCGSRLDTAS
jgi:hypothetical protein